MIISIRGRMYRLIPFIILTLILLFCFLLIVNACYKYHLETEERRQLLNTIKCKDCRTLVDKKQVEEVKPVEEIKTVEEEDKSFCKKCIDLLITDEKMHYNLPKDFEEELKKILEEITVDNMIENEFPEKYTYNKNKKIRLKPIFESRKLKQIQIKPTIERNTGIFFDIIEKIFIYDNNTSYCKISKGSYENLLL
jgi:hypothetical protein